MKNLKTLNLGLLAAVLASSIVGCSSSYAGGGLYQSAEKADSANTDARGMSYYTFDKDIKNSNSSACYQACATVWPPVEANLSTDERFGKIQRTDGSQQLTYQGKPLYYFSGDTNSGDTKGDGVKGVWHVLTSGKAQQSSNGYGSSY